MTAGRRARQALLLPRVIALGVRAPRDPHVAWRRFWSEIDMTGDGGDVLWDSSSTDEVGRYAALAGSWFDPSLPVIDLGCGNGRFTRALAGTGSRVIGVDLAEAAVARAAAELTLDPRPDVSFRAMDITDPRFAIELLAEVGAANVFIRGVLHVLDPAERRRLATAVKTLVDGRGTLMIAETDHRSGTLDYLESLGATPRRIPPTLARAIRTLPRPHHFGRPEMAATFGSSNWETVLEGPTTLDVVPTGDATAVSERVPAFLAVLRPR